MDPIVLSRSRNLKALVTAGAALGALLGGTGSVPAQTAAPQSAEAATPPGGVEEVVVTARARREDIQKVPAQVTAFTAEEIEAKGITTPADFLDAVPNVTFVSTQNAGTSFIVIRGISPGAQQRTVRRHRGGRRADDPARANSTRSSSTSSRSRC